MKKNLLIAVTVAAIGIGSLGAVGLASAASSPSTSSGSSIVDKLVAKFGLKKADVQTVFDEEHAAREAEHTKQATDTLAAGVKAGTITRAQSDAITAKVKELQATRDSNHDKMDAMTDTERKAAMDAERTAMTKWVSDNKIPDEFARLFHFGRHMGDHDRMSDDMPQASSDTTTN